MVGAGRLDRRITLQRATTSLNAFNEPIETWSTLAAVYASKEDVSAAESYRAQEVAAQLTTRFVIRYSSGVADLNERDRIIFDGGVYNIVGVRELGRFKWLEINAVHRPDIAAEVNSP